MNEDKKLPIEEKTEIIPAPIVDTNGSMLSEQFVETADKQIVLRSRLLMTGLKALKPHDFQNFEGKPYLEGEGAARIMAVVRGFKVGEARFVIETMTPHYFIDCSIPMEFMGATTVAIGDCSTSDVFFTGRDGKGGRFGKYLNQTGSDVMAARLLLGDAKKKARENAISRGVSELLGIKGLSWSDLAELGFNRSQAGATITFKQGSQGAETKVYTPSSAITVKVGSKISIRGICEDAKQREVKTKNGPTPITDYTLIDKNGKIKISAWGSCIENLKIGQEIFCNEVVVSEYQGRTQFMAKEVSVVVEDEVTDEK